VLYGGMPYDPITVKVKVRVTCPKFAKMADFEKLSPPQVCV